MLYYKALALQSTCYAINTISITNGQQHILEHIHRVGKQIQASKRFIGPDLKLVVLPEYFATGYPMGESIQEWQAKACVRNGDAAYQLMAKYAVDNNVYISGNWYELDAHFAQLYFQTSFIINDQGETILRYRRLNSMYAPTPHDVLDEYIKVYGVHSIFPVVSTPLGKLACIASEEIMYPEIARCLVLNGAQVLLHSSSEVGSTLATPKHIGKLARATENMAYVISANSASILGTPVPVASTDGASLVVQYEGTILAQAAYGESMVANATIDIAALNHARQRPGMANYLSRQRLELYAPTYSGTIYPANNLHTVTPTRDHFIATQQQVINKQYT